jgi:hypothetical protein
MYIIDISEKIKTDPKCFFNFVDYKRSTKGLPQSMFFKDDKAEGNNGISNLFSTFFSNVYESNNSNQNTNVFNSGDINLDINNLSVDVLDVSKYLCSLPTDKGAGPDGIPSVVLKKLGLCLSVPVQTIFSSSLNSGEFPTFWKISHITPIFKDGDRKNVENYRGVAIISQLPKLLEKIVYDQIFHGVCTRIIKEQHGFISGRSVSTNLVSFLNKVLLWMEEGYQVDTVYTDFSKAFDKVSHEILIKKLGNFGFGGTLLEWMKSYLIHRVQYVNVCGARSTFFRCLSGVPQGSHLGPLFFILFINDVCDVFDNVHFLIYADDIKIFFPVKTSNDCDFLQSKLNQFFDWCTLNRLSLNVKKCKCITYSRKLSNIIFNYKFDSQEIVRCDVVNDLGVMLDKKLLFDVQIDYIVNKAMKCLGFIKRFGKEFNDLHVHKVLYFTYVRSILEFACNVWSPYFQNSCYFQPMKCGPGCDSPESRLARFVRAGNSNQIFIKYLTQFIERL